MIKQTILTIICLCIMQNIHAQNNAIDIDGINDFIAISDHSSLDITGSVTIEAWIKPDIITPEKTILIKGTANQCVNYGLFIKDGNLAYVSGGSCGWTGRGTNATIQIGEWQHVAAVASGTNLKLYINGTLTDNITLTNAIGPTNNQQLWIGNSTAGLSNYLNASLDEVRIWNITRSSTEIFDSMNNEVDCSTPGLVAYYKFNQGIAGGSNLSETSLIDCTINGNNGILTNLSLTGTSSNWVERNIILPVTLVKFSAYQKENGVSLEWTTSQEINNHGFEIQKSINGIHWTPIGFIEGRGSSMQINNYCYLDNNLSYGISYYRLRQLNFDGTSEFSSIISTHNTKKNILIFPNPFTENIEILGIDNVNLKVINITGSIIKEYKLINGKINLSDLPTGIYFIQIEDIDKVFRKKIVKK